jgi:V8-like Glu-specific endopeptidase
LFSPAANADTSVVRVFPTKAGGGRSVPVGRSRFLLNQASWGISNAKSRGTFMVQPVLIADPQSWLWAGFVRAVFPNQPPNIQYYAGTGCLIGPRVVLTAGHVVYDPSKGGYATAVDVTFGGRTTPPTSAYLTTTQWQNTDSTSSLAALSAFDVAVILLPEAIDSAVPVVQFQTASDQMLAGMSLSLVGYPIDPPETLGRLYGAQSPPLLGAALPDGLAGLTDSRLFYPIESREGLSGGPVYDVHPQTKIITVRGVHSGEVTGIGKGVRINDNIFRLLTQWLLDHQP